MAGKPTGAKTSWTNLLIGSGLAAGVTTIGAYAVENARGAQESCAVAASVLQDETLSPYLTDKARRRLVEAAAKRFAECMKD